VELNEVLLILGIFIPSFAGVLWQLNRINPGKKTPKRAHDGVDTSLSELVAVQKEVVTEILKTKTNQIKSLEKKLKLETEVDEPEEGKEVVRFEDIKTLVKKSYPDYAKFLNMPGAEKYVMKQVKGMSLEECIEMVEEWTGKKVARGDGSEQNSQSQENNPNYI